MKSKGQPAEADGSNPFLTVLSHVPALISACTEPSDGSRGSTPQAPYNTGFLRALRLASRAGRAIASRATTSFTLTLNSKTSRDMSREVMMIDGACLRSLSIKVEDTVLMRTDGKQADANQGEETSFWSVPIQHIADSERL